MTNVPAGAAIAAASDKYYLYRPMLDYTEGNDMKRGYNETRAKLDGKLGFPQRLELNC